MHQFSCSPCLALFLSLPHFSDGFVHWYATRSESYIQSPQITFLSLPLSIFPPSLSLSSIFVSSPLLFCSSLLIKWILPKDVVCPIKTKGVFVQVINILEVSISWNIETKYLINFYYLRFSIDESSTDLWLQVTLVSQVLSENLSLQVLCLSPKI